MNQTPMPTLERNRSKSRRRMLCKPCSYACQVRICRPSRAAAWACVRPAAARIAFISAGVGGRGLGIGQFNQNAIFVLSDTAPVVRHRNGRCTSSFRLRGSVESELADDFTSCFFDIQCTVFTRTHQLKKFNGLREIRHDDFSFNLVYRVGLGASQFTWHAKLFNHIGLIFIACVLCAKVERFLLCVGRVSTKNYAICRDLKSGHDFLSFKQPSKIAGMCVSYPSF